VGEVEGGDEGPGRRSFSGGNGATTRLNMIQAVQGVGSSQHFEGAVMRHANVRPLGLCVCMITATAFGLDALQTPASTGARFETISITSSANERGSGSAIKTLPDGTFVMTNGEIRSIILAGSPVPVREVKGAQ